MSVVTFPDTEGAVRAFLRASAAVSALVGQRVFFGVPDSPTWPLVTVQRVGGGDDLGEAPIDQALIQLDCWGRLYSDSDPTKKHGDKAQARAVANAVRAAVHEVRSDLTTYAGCVLYGASVNSDLFVPDPDNDRPRYSLLTSWSARTA